MGISKRYKENFEKIDINKDYLLDDAIEILNASNKVKFDETYNFSSIPFEIKCFNFSFIRCG